MCAIIIGLKQLAGRREPTGARNGETEARDGVRRIAATDRYVKVPEAVHVSTAEIRGQEVRGKIRNSQSGSAADNVESEDAVVAVTITKCCEARRHLNGNVDAAAAVEHVSDGCVWTRRSAQARVRCVDDYLVRLCCDGGTQSDDRKHREGERDLARTKM